VKKHEEAGTKVVARTAVLATSPIRAVTADFMALSWGIVFNDPMAEGRNRQDNATLAERPQISAPLQFEAA
jgi:hypothetical protein